MEISCLSAARPFLPAPRGTGGRAAVTEPGGVGGAPGAPRQFCTSKSRGASAPREITRCDNGSGLKSEVGGSIRAQGRPRGPGVLHWIQAQGSRRLDVTERVPQEFRVWASSSRARWGSGVWSSGGSTGVMGPDIHQISMEDILLW